MTEASISPADVFLPLAAAAEPTLAPVQERHATVADDPFSHHLFAQGGLAPQQSAPAPFTPSASARRRSAQRASFMLDQAHRNIRRRRTEPGLNLARRERTRRDQVYALLNKSKVGRVWESFQMLLAAVGCVVYIVSSYIIRAGSEEITGINLFEIVLSSFFFVDLCLNAFASDSRRWFFLQPFTWVDIVSILPSVLTAIQFSYGTSVYFLRIVRMLRILRILRTHRLMHITKSGSLAREMSLLVYIVSCLILCSAALFQIVEDDQNLAFHDCVYYVVITITTVGYGDITPTSPSGRLLVMIFILVIIVVVPMRVNRLVDLLALRSPFRGAYRNPGNTRHIIIAGVFDTTSLRLFLEQFFATSEVHQQDIHVVVIGPNPSRDMRLLLESALATIRCTYLEGSAMTYGDLVRARVHATQACFLLCDRASENPEMADAQTILRALCVHKCNSRVPIFVECLLPLSKRALYDVGATTVVCIHEMRNKLLAVSCIVRGFHTLVTNLVKSDQCRKLLNAHAGRGLSLTQGSITDEPMQAWEQEYFAGASRMLCTCKVDNLLHGQPFSVAAGFIFREYSGVITIGVRNDTDGVLLNPGKGYILSNTDVLYVLVPNISVAQEIGRIKVSYITVAPGELRPQMNLASPKPVEDVASPTSRGSTVYLLGSSGSAGGRSPTGSEAATEEPRSASGSDERTQQLAQQAAAAVVGENSYSGMLEQCEFDLPVFLTTDLPHSVTTAVMLEKPRDIAGITIMQLPSSVRDHVVIFGQSDCYHHFVLPLRSAHIGRMRTLLFVTPDALSREQLQLLAVFKEVYVLKADVNNTTDSFERCRLANCSCVVILPPKQFPRPAQFTDGEPMVDFKAMMAFLKIQAQFPELQSITVLLHPYNDRFICGSRYRNVAPLPNIGGAARSIRPVLPKPARIMDSGGMTFNDRVFENILCKSFFTRETVEIIEAMICSPSFASRKREICSHCFLVDIPSALEGRSFYDLFYALLMNDIVAIGLFRRAPRQQGKNSSVRFDRRPAYVYTAPQCDTILTCWDQVYVLAVNEPTLQQLSSIKPLG
eukprot:TRINITY_DN34031_c0_g1_i1.p1 TRINITY_DN34031_c0_g1~~TRINITY_DN34031_c0_g1_i1.p1  ORF type:complete len:1057 (-),score=112.98 TRINITY_DN34031_c0_g1_i1:44-3214(-)